MRTEPEFLERISNAVVAAGARTVNIPDTVTFSTPDESGGLIGAIVKGACIQLAKEHGGRPSVSGDASRSGATPREVRRTEASKVP